MQRLFLALVVATTLIAAVGLFLIRGELDETAESASFTHMHCPDCRLEMRYDPATQARRCPRCGPTGPELVATVGPRGAHPAPTVGPVGKTLVALVVMLIVGEVLAYGFMLFQRSRQSALEQERNRLLVCKCPFCRRKIGYGAKRVGAGAICPRCKTAFVLPEGSPALEQV